MKFLLTILLVFLFSLQLFAQVFWEEIVPYTVKPQSLSVSRNGNVFIIEDYGLIRSTDHGQSWDSISVAPTGVSDFGTSPTGPIYLFNDLFRKSTDEGNSWITVVSPFGMYRCWFLMVNHLGDIFTQPEWGYNRNTFRSTDEGKSWDIIGIDSSVIGDLIFKDDLTFASFHDGSGSEDGLYRSSDKGDTWEILPNAPTHLGALFASKAGKLFAITYSNYENPLFVMSPDNGNSWEAISEFDSILVRDIEENQFGHIFLATVSQVWGGVISGVFRSTDDGVSWQQINSGLNHSDCQKLAIDSSGYVYVVAGSSQRLYRSIHSTIPVELVSFSAKQIDDNIHLKWQTATELNNQGFEIERKTENSEWRIIGFKEGNGTTAEAHYYSFIDENTPSGKNQYRLKQIDYDGRFEYSKTVEVDVLVVSSFSLEQNYPNPFNPSTKIKYYIPTISIVNIKVFDALGKEVATLVNEEKPAGTYEVIFIDETPSSGIYFYHLRAGDFVETKKMLLLK